MSLSSMCDETRTVTETPHAPVRRAASSGRGTSAASSSPGDSSVSTGRRPTRSASGWLFLAALVATSLAPSASSAQITCTCTSERALGSCRLQDLSLTNAYPGQTPGPIEIVEENGDTFILAADLFSGSTYVYSGADILISPPTTFPSPRGSQPTSGLAYAASNDRLYWLIDDRLVVTAWPMLAINAGVVARVAIGEGGIPVEVTPAFDDVVAGGSSLEFTINAQSVATAALGAAAEPSKLGDLAYHAGRDKLWTVDIVNDIYFELNLDGSISMEGGAPVWFRSPGVDELSAKAYGNSFTYVSNANGEFFDLLVGSRRDRRPNRVVRVTAPTDGTIGGATGLGYPLFATGLVPGDSGQLFPTSIEYWETSCNQTKNSELLFAFNPNAPPDSANANEKHAFLDISADTPRVSNVIGLDASVANDSAIELTWTNTTFETLAISRRAIDEAPGAAVTIFTSEGPNHPQRFLDAQLPLPVDGTYVYSIVTRAGTGASAVESLPETITVTIGTGSLLARRRIGVDSDNPAPSAVTSLGDRLLAIDALTGGAQRIDPTTLEAEEGVISGAFTQIGGQTTGAAYVASEDRIYWLGHQGTLPLLVATNATGGELGQRRTVQFPADFVRTPIFGDLAWDEAHGHFWIVDRTHQAIFGIGRDGRLIEGTTIENPTGAALGGGISVVETNETTVTLDIVTGEPTANRVDRIRYTIGQLDAPEVVASYRVGHSTRSVQLGGTTTGQYQGRDALFLVASDTRAIYAIQTEAATPSSTPFQRGDANNDGSLNISDPSFVLSWLFRDGVEPPCREAADVNDDDSMNISDAVALFGYLFRDGAPPAAPSLGCGFGTGEVDCEDSICLGG